MSDLRSYCTVDDCQVRPTKGVVCSHHRKSALLRSKHTRFCRRCGREWVQYRSTQGSLFTGTVAVSMEYCRSCRKPYAGVIQRHRLDAVSALRLLEQVRCELCGASPRIRNGRPALVVDHDHQCCPTETSCGVCVRGFICYPCNTALGHLDGHLMRSGVLDKALEYLTRPTLARAS